MNAIQAQEEFDNLTRRFHANLQFGDKAAVKMLGMKIERLKLFIRRQQIKGRKGFDSVKTDDRSF